MLSAPKYTIKGLTHIAPLLGLFFVVYILFGLARIIRTAQGNTHLGKNGINKAPCSPQDQPENTLNEYNSCDGKV